MRGRSGKRRPTVAANELMRVILQTRHERLVARRALLEDALLPNMTVVEVTPTDFRLAETLLREFPLGLRAGDALHLATASRCAVQQFVSLDRKLCNVAQALGLPVMAI